MLSSTVEEFLTALFSEKTCHHAVIRLVSPWLVNDYYREFCYEDDEVDLMKVRRFGVGDRVYCAHCRPHPRPQLFT